MDSAFSEYNLKMAKQVLLDFVQNVSVEEFARLKKIEEDKVKTVKKPVRIFKSRQERARGGLEKN